MEIDDVSAYIPRMTSKSPKKPDDPEQSKRFIDAAKEAVADETEKGADRAFKKVVKPGDRKVSSPDGA
jgi:hypothetical protein